MVSEIQKKRQVVYLTASIVAIFHIHIAIMTKISAPGILDNVIRYRP